MNQNELFHLLALLQVEGVGDIMAKKLLTAFGSATDVFQSKPNQLRAVDGIGDVLVRKLKDKTIFEKAAVEMQFIQQEGIRVLYFTDENFNEKKQPIANFIKETFMTDYDIREISLIQDKTNLDGTYEDNPETKFESVDQIVLEQLLNLEYEQYNKTTLLDIYKNL